MSSTIILRIDPSLKEKFQKITYSEGKNASQVLRNLVEDYVQNRDMGAYIDDLWGRVEKKFKKRSIRSKDIRQAIRKVRSSHS